ncbi:MAG TPA: hypothetical protein VFX68_09925 [Sulfuricurvum sp.]|nr:hypothetical protein [Sulfuricurvum sp.]
MIKELVILMAVGMTSTILASDAVTVQVISAVHEKSVTKEFDGRLKKTGLEVHKKVENGRHVVTLGSFNDKKSSHNALKKARLVVTKDAFLRPVNRQTTAVAQTKPQVAATVAQKVSTVPAATAAAVVSPVASAPTATVTPVQAIKPSISSVPSECDKKEMKKDAFAEAIRYYKNSPYHRFEPVVLRQ